MYSCLSASPLFLGSFFLIKSATRLTIISDFDNARERSRSLGTKAVSEHGFAIDSAAFEEFLCNESCAYFIQTLFADDFIRASILTIMKTRVNTLSIITESVKTLKFDLVMTSPLNIELLLPTT